jgi:methionyl aminopeptidase
VNDELIHGIPKDEVLEAGDKVSYDLVIKYNGYYVDSAFTMIVGGKPTAAQKHLLSFTESALYEGIERVKPGA